MALIENLKNLVGEWSGTNRLHVPWMEENPIRESASTASISLAAKDGFLKIEYDWIFDDEKQEGLLLLGGKKNSSVVKSVWIDSWHSSDDFLTSEGNVEPDKAVSIKGFYKVPNHPDWGWRTIIEPENDNSFKIVMYNVSPEGEESLAVECEFSRS